jgi:putative nucleotidyltransferase with HDIG domain
MTQEEQILNLLQSIIKGSEWENKVFLVGGAVRDQIMGKPPKDLDFVVQGNISAGIDFSIWLAQRLKVYKEGSNPVIYPTFGTSKLSYNSINMEFVAPRKEQYTAGSRKPQVSGGVLMDDSLRRDLTINSLMRNVSTNEVLDLTGKGLNDIKQGIIRTPSEPDVIFKEDSLRMLRAIRFTVKYGFKISEDILESITKNSDWINNISQERIQDELNKILVTNKPVEGIELLRTTGLLKHIIPELDQMAGLMQNRHHKEDAYQHTLSVLRNTPPNLISRLMGLFHDIGKVTTKSVTPEGEVHFIDHEKIGEQITKNIMTRLKYPNDIINTVALGVKSHMSLKHGTDDASKLSDKTLRKFSVASGGNLSSFLDLIHADNMSHSETSSMPNQVNFIKQRIEKLNAPTVKSDIKLPIDGNDVIGMGVKQGPLVGKIMDAVQDAWYENPDLTREEALKIVNDMKLKNEINEIRRIMYGNIIQEDKISYIGNFELKQDPFSQHYNVEISNVSKKVSSFDSEFDPISNEKIQALVDKLIRLQMITLIGGITDYTKVSIEIWEIDEDSGLYIETYHQLDDDEGLSDYDATMRYSDFLEK